MKIASILILFSLIIQQSHARPYTIGMVFDGPLKRKLLPIEQIKSEVLTLTQDEFDIQFPDNKVLNGRWQLESIQSALNQLNQDTSVDMILANGILASHLAARMTTINKPIIATVIADRILQNLPYKDGMSGKHHFNYISDSHTVEQDIRQFYALKPFQHLIIPADINILEALPTLRNTFTQVQKELGFKMSIIPIRDNLQTPLTQFPASGDAVYMPPLLRFNKQQLKQFAAAINQRKLASFALLGRTDLELGFMATISGRKVDALRFSRRIALNIQNILLGTPASELKVELDQPPKLAINMQTAHEIGLSFKWEILEQAEQLYKPNSASVQTITLVEAVNRAVVANLNLQADKQNINLANDQVDSARSTLLPQLSIGLNNTFIDQDRAGLLQPERTTDAELKLSQLIYSEQNWSNFEVAELLKQAEDAAFQSRVLNVIQTSATGYLQVLLARASEQIRQADLKVSEANLELAQSRLKIGYSDRSDVLRWQSEIANDRSNVYFARSDREQAETLLKQQLHLSLRNEIQVSDEGIARQIEMLNHEKYSRFFDNPYSFNIFTEFEVERALSNAPELKQNQHLLDSSKRQLTAAKRAYFIPDVSLNAQLGQNISQGGNGANNNQFQQDDWTVAIQASLPLYTSGARPAEVSRAHHSIQQIHYQQASIHEQIETRVRTALQKAKGSYSAIRLSKISARTAEENFELVTDSYAKGIASITRLIDAQNAVLSANLSVVQALYSFMIDWVEIQRSVANFDLLLNEHGMENWYQQLNHYFSHQ